MGAKIVFANDPAMSSLMIPAGKCRKVYFCPWITIACIKFISMQKKKTFSSRFLYLIERGGNILPHPASLFGILALLALVFSWLGSEFD
jgi:hypothetical protein